MAIVGSPDHFDDTDVQGDVLPGFRHRGHKDYEQRFLFLTVADRDDARGALARMLDSDTITTGRRLVDDDGRPRPVDSAVNISFTWHGLERLGLDSDWRAAFDGHDAFKAGLAQRTRHDPKLLGDPTPWLIGSPDSDVDAVVNVGGERRADVDAAVASVEDQIEGQGFDVVRPSQDGALRPEWREPFGFTDGLSQPLVGGYHDERTNSLGAGQVAQPAFAGYPTDEDLAYQRAVANIENAGYGEARKARELEKLDAMRPSRSAVQAVTRFSDDGRPLLPADRFLVQPSRDRDPATPFTANGSFMVWIRFEQHPELFQTHCDTVARSLGGRWQKELTGDDVGALVIGRRKSGMSLIDEPLFGDGEPPPARREAFFYVPHDSSGRSCPLGAHARKMNPRTIKGLEQAILRRGIPFGGDGQGLLFVCYQSSIEQQYETLQRWWANEVYQPEPNGSPDPLISQALRERGGTIEIPNVGAGGSRTVAVKNDWVVPTGGLYLFVPSLRALRMLARTP